MNRFWSAVCQVPVVDDGPPAAIDAVDLGHATELALHEVGVMYAFRRPRELVDLRGQFRHFTYGDHQFVTKRASISNTRHEVENARVAAELLAGCKAMRPVVPRRLAGLSRDHEQVLVTADGGPTLAHRPERLREAMPMSAFLAAMDRLLSRGIEWVGFQPRNVIREGDGSLGLIDWEDCRFSPSGIRCRDIGDLTMLFWSIGWAGHYGLTAERFASELCRTLELTVRVELLDQFERAYAAIVGNDLPEHAVRRRCSPATIATEAPRPGGSPDDVPRHDPDVVLGHADLGHLLDELLPPHLSVLYTFATHTHSHLGGGDWGRYGSVVRLLNRALLLGTTCRGFESDSAGWRRLQGLLLAVITATLLDGADPSPLTRANSAVELIEDLADASGTVAGLLSCSDSSAVAAHPMMRRFLTSGAQCLGLARPAVDRAGEPSTRGLGDVRDDAVDLFSALSLSAWPQAIRA